MTAQEQRRRAVNLLRGFAGYMSKAAFWAQWESGDFSLHAQDVLSPLEERGELKPAVDLVWRRARR